MSPIDKIKAIFEKYTDAYHFYLKDFRDGREYELGVKQRFPICSCFKLAVLMAYFDSIKDESELFEEVIIPPEKFSPGGGVINYFTTPVKFTYFQLAQMMMAFSDGTATDVLIEKVGLSSVSEFLDRFTDQSKITKNLARMVIEFTSSYNYLFLKNSNAKMEFHFDDYTNAQDLAKLSTAALQFKPSNISRSKYLEALEVARQLPRLGMYLPKNARLIGKGGSLGYVYFANDCGVVLIENEPIASIGVVASGMRVDKDVCEVVFASIGYHAWRLLDLPADDLTRYSFDTRSLIE